MRKILRIFLYIIGSLLLIVLILIVVLRIISPGKAEPITDLKGKTIAGSISAIEKVKLGGLEQYLIIRGADSTKPVMLFLHGGPGSPEFMLMKNMNPAIENDFVMVYWEQRGAGKSYSKQIPVKSMNLSQFIADTRELSEMLAKRFKKKKIYLTGHSWGSLLGILTAWKYPGLFYAYLGIGQVCYQFKGEQISFEWIKEQAAIRNDDDAIETISKINFPDSLANSKTWLDYMMRERGFVTRFGGGPVREMNGMWPMIKMVILTREYTFGEKVNYMPANLFSLQCLWSEVINNNLFSVIDSMQLPVYMFGGIYDYQTPYSVAKDFFDQLKAPQKEFFTFNNSSHSPIFEEADKFNSIIREKILKNKQEN